MYFFPLIPHRTKFDTVRQMILFKPPYYHTNVNHYLTLAIKVLYLTLRAKKDEKLETIEADIIVVGNKYNHSLEEIESKIKGEHEIIYVDFSKSL